MSEFLSRLRPVVETYLAREAEADEWLPVLTWQIDERHALDSRETYPAMSRPARSFSRRWQPDPAHRP